MGNKTLILFIFLLLNSCGSNKKTSAPDSEASNVEAIKKSFAPVNFNPSQGNGDFLDITQSAGLENLSSVRNYIVDLNADGREDLVILPEHYSTPRFFERTDTGFSSSKSIFFDEQIKASFLIFDDFNKDGIPDVLVGVHNQKTELTKQPIQIFLGARSRGNLIFKREKRLTFSGVYPVTTASIFDYNNDGQLDVFIGNWFDLSKKEAQVLPDKLYTYKDQKLVDISKSLESEYLKIDGKYINAAPTFGVSHCDLNQDSVVDILVTNSAGRANKLWLGKRDSFKDSYAVKFQNVGRESRFSGDIEGASLISGNGNSNYAICADYNNDGIFDIALGETTRSYDDESRDRSSILTGEGLSQTPTFIRTDYTSDRGISNWNQSDLRGVWFDYNNDGLIDLLVENSGFPPESRLILFKQNPDHSFEDVSRIVGTDVVNPTGSVVFDYDGDGLEDILVSVDSIRDSRITRRIYLFKNNVKNKNNFQKFNLKGSNSNISGIGSTIKVTTKDGITQMRYLQPSYGPLPSQNSMVLNFGLGNSEISKVEVIWPFIKNNSNYKKTYYPPFSFNHTLKE